MENEWLAEKLKKDNNASSVIPVTDGVRKMTPEQIQNRRRTTVNNIAERQMFGFTSNNYKNKFKNK